MGARAQGWGNKLSGIATFALLLHLAVSWIRHVKRLPTSASQAKAARLLRTHSGILLALLLLADLIQAVGFSLSFRWSINGGMWTQFGLGHVPSLCTTQGVLIQMGDLASAFLVRRVRLGAHRADSGRRRF
jgi:hypothetical protein